VRFLKKRLWRGRCFTDKKTVQQSAQYFFSSFEARRRNCRSEDNFRPKWLFLSFLTSKNLNNGFLKQQETLSCLLIWWWHFEITNSGCGEPKVRL